MLGIKIHVLSIKELPLLARGVSVPQDLWSPLQCLPHPTHTGKQTPFDGSSVEANLRPSLKRGEPGYHSP